MSANTRNLHRAQFGMKGKGPEDQPFRGWKSELDAIIKEHNHLKKDGTHGASHRTMEERERVLFRCFKELREHCSLLIDNPRNLKPKHVEALARLWESRQQSAATIQGKMSILRTFAGWIGKPGMITASADYVSDKALVTRTYAAEKDKSWSAAGLDVVEALKHIALVDPYVAMQIELIAMFGMRRKEGVMFDPFLADQGPVLLLDRGTKGGRSRFALIDTPAKRALVDRAKAFVLKMKGGKGHIGEPGKDLKQNLKRYSNVLSRMGITKENLGITGHGLRAEFVCDRLEERGITAPVRSGSGIQETSLSESDQELVLKKTSEEVGHSRTSVIAAYCGQFSVMRSKKAGRPPGAASTVSDST
ncbi:MAG: phage integrase N-terminal domain-containing protein [Georgfuchsia sp.]